MTRYRKLVRDNVVELIEAQGESCVWHSATEEEYRKLLPLKLTEEVDEFVKERTLDEFADTLQVALACAAFYKFEPTLVMGAREHVPERDRDEFHDPDAEFDVMMALQDAASAFAASPSYQGFHHFLIELWSLACFVFVEADLAQAEAVRLKKLEERGGFDERIVLDEA